MASLDLVVVELRKAREQAAKEVNCLDAALSALGSLNGSFRGARPKRARKPMSASARRKIAAAQRARWANVKGQKIVEIAARKARTMSPAARRKIAAAQRARWAKSKKERRAA